MSTLSYTNRCAGSPGLRLTWPRLGLRRIVAWLAALDTRHRERAYLAAMDAHMLRDIGLTRADVSDALRRRDEHLRLILLRGGDQFQH